MDLHWFLGFIYLLRWTNGYVSMSVCVAVYVFAR